MYTYVYSVVCPLVFFSFFIFLYKKLVLQQPYNHKLSKAIQKGLACQRLLLSLRSTRYTTCKVHSGGSPQIHTCQLKNPLPNQFSAHPQSRSQCLPHLSITWCSSLMLHSSCVQVHDSRFMHFKIKVNLRSCTVPYIRLDMHSNIDLFNRHFSISSSILILALSAAMF